MRLQHLALPVLLGLFAFAIFTFMGTTTKAMELGSDLKNNKPTNYPSIVLGGGCFWCLESEFRALDGILYTRAGYAGGQLENPTYNDVTTGTTGHAEVIEITYDPEKISYKDLLEFFLTSAHDPTQTDGQWVDKGTQYRSVIFYNNEGEKEIAQSLITELDNSGRFKKPITTAVVPLVKLWPAEDYHQQYYEKYQEKTGSKHLRVILKEQKKLKKAKAQ